LIILSLGLYEVVPPDWLAVFDYQELELLLCGVPEIDVSDWIRHTEYLGEYKHLQGSHKVIRWFWLAVESMSPEDRVRLLQFTTGCSRLPAQGFKALQSSDGHYRRFNIQSIRKSVRNLIKLC
jgi:E3 ubiquitin-protein ligase NEDD4